MKLEDIILWVVTIALLAGLALGLILGTISSSWWFLLSVVCGFLIYVG